MVFYEDQEQERKVYYVLNKVDNENEEEYVPGDVKVRLASGNYLTLGWYIN